MDKAKLERNLREIHKALWNKIDKRYFTPLYKDITCWKSWNALHVVSEGYSCDPAYVSLIEECFRSTIRGFLGVIA